jgi:phosphatidylserine decarboxylase
MAEVHYIDRKSQKKEKELIYGKIFIELLYGKNFFSRFLYFSLLPIFSKFSFTSKLYGFFQKSSFSRSKVQPFIKTFNVDTSEFLAPVESFKCFNDFFIRKLKPEARPLAGGSEVAVLPADGRYLFYSHIEAANQFLIKGEKLFLTELLQDNKMAEHYTQGSMLIARLCPVDYHRFHFPCDCTPGSPRLINGHLFSVNPIALKRNIDILSQNKRVITSLHTKNLGTVLYIEVGATYVGSIHQTFVPGRHYAKGDEKGFFEFGGSCLILLFEPGSIQFDQDLLDISKGGLESRCEMGQSLGKALKR